MNNNNINSADDDLIVNLKYINDKTAKDVVVYLHKYLMKKESEEKLKENEAKLEKSKVKTEESKEKTEKNYNGLKPEEKYNELEKQFNSLLAVRKELGEKCEKLEKSNAKLQSALGNATSFRFSDNDKNNTVQFTDDILRLQDSLERYVTNLRPNIEVNYKNVNNLLIKYKSNPISPDSKISNTPLIKAVLQRHVLETIFDYVSKYSEQEDSLETAIAHKTEELIQLAKELEENREGIDSITRTVPIKIRQQIYSALGNRGFSNISNEQKTHEHYFINKFKTELNLEMEKYRKIKDDKKKKEVEEKAASIILDTVRIFFFRIQTQEPIGQIRWFQNKDKIDPDLMTGTWDDDNFDDLEVDICKFPLIGIELSDSFKRKVYTQAIILHREVNPNVNSSQPQDEYSSELRTQQEINNPQSQSRSRTSSDPRTQQEINNPQSQSRSRTSSDPRTQQEINNSQSQSRSRTSSDPKTQQEINNPRNSSEPKTKSELKNSQSRSRSQSNSEIESGTRSAEKSQPKKKRFLNFSVSGLIGK